MISRLPKFSDDHHGSHGSHGGFESGKPANRDLKNSSRSFDEKLLRRSRRFGHRLEGSKIPAKLVDDSGLSYTAQSRYESALGITSSDYVIGGAESGGRVVTTLRGGGVYLANKTRPPCRSLSYILEKILKLPVNCSIKRHITARHSHRLTHSVVVHSPFCRPLFQPQTPTRRPSNRYLSNEQPQCTRTGSLVRPAQASTRARLNSSPRACACEISATHCRCAPPRHRPSLPT